MARRACQSILTLDYHYNIQRPTHTRLACGLQSSSTRGFEHESMSELRQRPKSLPISPRSREPQRANTATSATICRTASNCYNTAPPSVRSFRGYTCLYPSAHGNLVPQHTDSESTANRRWQYSTLTVANATRGGNTLSTNIGVYYQKPVLSPPSPNSNSYTPVLAPSRVQ
ncbi:hypothetical protein BC835DRAFT_1068280 [Cytidiella melzeri]|nr:hypothetical protein BC835DRAFT_1068280 [Cytidiella melzeri]